MIPLVAGLLLVLALDQALKALVVRGLAPAALSLGPLGKLEALRSRIWWAWPGPGLKLATLWRLWFVAAASLTLVTFFLPSCGWFAGVLLGGSLSHALETSMRGCIIDYVRLRFWPAFNLADVAITVGAVGMLVQAVIAATEAGA